MLLKISKILLILSLPLTIGASSCQSGDAPEFKWNPKIYAGDSRTSSYVREKDGKIEQHYCYDPDFDDRIILQKDAPKQAYKAYIDVINQCEKWK